MTTAVDPRPARRGPGLQYKLAAAVLALALLTAALLLAVVGPATDAGFARASTALLTKSATAMRALTTEHAQQSREVLVDLIGHTTDARRRALADLPLPLFADIEQLRSWLQDADLQRADRLRRNVAVLAAESQRRTDARIATVLDDLQHQQAQLAAAFAADLRRAHVALSAALLAIAVTAFGFGLWRLVVRPVGILRAATRRVADGDLSAAVPIASGDEIGALAIDFRTMVRQLQQSRAELAALNADLERKVDEKTRALAHAEKMASIGTLAGGIAHEFNNLIGGIRGCTNEVLADERDEERRATLGVVLRAADRAAAIVAQLRRFAHREPGAMDEVALEGVVADALRLAEPEARRRRVQVVRDLDADLRVRGDDGALHQVFVNLLTNALQAMPGGGTLTVTARRLGEQCEVAIADTGVGIAAADQDRVFEPFFTRRGDAADPAQRGTGLGLSVSYGIVDAHGGSIAFASTPGAGATFRVRLPLLR